MCGGFLMYSEDDIENIIADLENSKKMILSSSYYNYTAKTVRVWDNALKSLKTAKVLLSHIDALICNDETENDFHKNIKREIKEI